MLCMNFAVVKMRNYVRHSNRGQFSRQAMLSAVELVENGMSIRKAAAAERVNYKTLSRYVKVKSSSGTLDNASFGYTKVRQVFTSAMEAEIVQYAVHAANIFHGLTLTELRQFAFDLAKGNNLRMPRSWSENGTAGLDWAQSFMKRHKNDLAIRSPEATSIQRMTSFNEYNVNIFFENLKTALGRGFGPEAIWNIDETGVTTVQRPCKVVAQRGAKQVGAVVSQERGTLVTVCCGVNAIGNHMPPYFVFPRVNVQQQWHLTAPPGSVMAGHSKASGWMTTENFVDFMKHFVKYAKPSVEHPVLLLLDNHHSHISLEVLNFAKDNHITLLSFPPHCSHQLQPLDKAVYGPFKSFINAASDNWMRKPHNAGKSMSIHVIPSLVSYAFPKAFTTANITSGFKATGIWPFDRHIFPPETFLPSSVTDRPLATEVNDSAIPDSSGLAHKDHPLPENEVSQSSPEVEAGPSQPCTGRVRRLFTCSPEEIRPFARRSPRKNKTKRKKAKSQILTDTPVKSAIEAEAKAAKRSVKKRLIHESDNEIGIERGMPAATTHSATDIEPDEAIDAMPQRQPKSTVQKRKISKRLPSRQKPKKLKLADRCIRQSSNSKTLTSVSRRLPLRRPTSPSKRPPLPRKPVWLVSRPGWCMCQLIYAFSLT